MAAVQFTHTETNPALEHGEGGGRRESSYTEDYGIWHGEGGGRREFSFTEDHDIWHGEGGGRRVITHTEEIYLEFWAIGPSGGIAARLLESGSI